MSSALLQVENKAIELQAVVKRFGTTTALAGIDASLATGQLTGLVGPDGAGKTTLLRIMAALMHPDEGSARICGMDVTGDAQALHRQVGYMPQRFGLYEDLSVQQNMQLYADLKGIPSARQPETFARLYEFTRLEPFRKRAAGKLSGGMKQKLGLGCALMGQPPVLLLDEPSVGVDPVSRQDLWKMVQALADEGMAVVWATAYLDEAERCESVLLLDHGKVLHDGAPGNLTMMPASRHLKNWQAMPAHGWNRHSHALKMPSLICWAEVRTVAPASLNVCSRSVRSAPAWWNVST